MGEQIFRNFLAEIIKHMWLKSYMAPELLEASLLDLLDFGQAHLSLFSHSPRDHPLRQFLHKTQKVGIELFEFLHFAFSLHFIFFEE